MAMKSRFLEADLLVFGENITRWRRLHGLTAQMVAERAGITRPTLRSIERGDGTARLENVFAVLRVLDVSQLMLIASDPLSTDIGRANADRLIPKRIRPAVRKLGSDSDR